MAELLFYHLERQPLENALPGLLQRSLGGCGSSSGRRRRGWSAEPHCGPSTTRFPAAGSAADGRRRRSRLVRPGRQSELRERAFSLRASFRNCRYDRVVGMFMPPTRSAPARAACKRRRYKPLLRQDATAAGLSSLSAVIRSSSPRRLERLGQVDPSDSAPGNHAHGPRPWRARSPFGSAQRSGIQFLSARSSLRKSFDHARLLSLRTGKRLPRCAASRRHPSASPRPFWSSRLGCARRLARAENPRYSPRRREGRQSRQPDQRRSARPLSGGGRGNNITGGRIIVQAGTTPRASIRGGSSARLASARDPENLHRPEAVSPSNPRLLAADRFAAAVASSRLQPIERFASEPSLSASAAARERGRRMPGFSASICAVRKDRSYLDAARSIAVSG